MPSEGDPPDAFYGVEMHVVAQHRQGVLAAQRGDSCVVRGDGRTGPLELQPDLGVDAGGPRSYGGHVGERQVAAEPFFVARSVAGLTDAEVVLAEDDTRNDQPLRRTEGRFDRREPLGLGRHCVGVENHGMSPPGVRTKPKNRYTAAVW